VPKSQAGFSESCRPARLSTGEGSVDEETLQGKEGLDRTFCRNTREKKEAEKGCGK